MLTHHSSADYNASASAAAAEARIKLQREIDAGKERAAAVIEQIYTQVPKDSVVPAKRLTFLPDGNEMKVSYPRTVDGVTGEVVEGFHRHAIGQAANRADLTIGFIDKLMDRKENWAADLAAHNLTQIYNHDSDRYLLRSVKGQVRGFLSSAYRRMDSRPILEQFLDGIQRYGALPLDGFALETKFALKAILPHVFEPVPNEPMVIGLALQNSDFGNGKLTVAMFVERLWCTNRAISKDEISQVHLGKRLSEDLQLSQRTYELDTQTMASAAADTIENALNPDKVKGFLEGVKAANEAKVESREVLAFAKKYLTKGEADQVVEAFASAETEMLPAGQSRWRLSNAISWIANAKIEDEGRKLEVMRVAGLALEPNAMKLAEAA